MKLYRDDHPITEIEIDPDDVQSLEVYGLLIDDENVEDIERVGDDRANYFGVYIKFKPEAITAKDLEPEIWMRDYTTRYAAEQYAKLQWENIRRQPTAAIPYNINL